MRPTYKDQPLNPEICEIVGAFIGDGYLGNYGKRKNHYVIGFSGNKTLDEDYLTNHLCKLLKKQFISIRPHIQYRKEEHTIVLKIYSKELFLFFVNLGFKPGSKSRNVVIPPRIVRNKKLLLPAIRGIFDTDGCVFLDKRKNYRIPYARITIQTASIPLIQQLQEVLSQDYTLYVDKSNRDGKRNTLEIYGHRQLEKFLKQVSFSNKRHLSKIMPLWPSGMALPWYFPL